MRRPLSKRNDPEAAARFDGPYRGVPEHLWPSLAAWIGGCIERRRSVGGYVFGDPEMLRAMERQLNLALDWTQRSSAEEDLMRRCSVDENICLDVVDWLLAYTNASEAVSQLDRILKESRSVWTVGVDESGIRQLQERVDPIVQQSAETAAPTGSRSGHHLAASWSRSYGKVRDPSGAYREAVRAVEVVAIQLVSPNNSKATLGTVLGEMRANPDRWRVILRPSDGSNGTNRLIGMMELLWNSQIDRHGCVDDDMPLNVSPEEAEAALHIAAALVHLFSSGAVVAAN
jgi:hypothetical protein